MKRGTNKHTCDYMCTVHPGNAPMCAYTRAYVPACALIHMSTCYASSSLYRAGSHNDHPVNQPRKKTGHRQAEGNQRLLGSMPARGVTPRLMLHLSGASHRPSLGRHTHSYHQPLPPQPYSTVELRVPFLLYARTGLNAPLAQKPLRLEPGWQEGWHREEHSQGNSLRPCPTPTPSTAPAWVLRMSWHQAWGRGKRRGGGDKFPQLQKSPIRSNEFVCGVQEGPISLASRTGSEVQGHCRAGVWGGQTRCHFWLEVGFQGASPVHQGPADLSHPHVGGRQ